MKIGTKLLAVVLASVLLVAVVATNLQQQSVSAFGFVERQQFKKLTHEFEKNVIKTIKDTNTGPQPHLRELLQAYSQGVQRIFIGDPGLDQVKTLLQSYEQDVTTIFDQNPPHPDKQLIKEFKGTTNDFVKAVIDAFTGPED
jgi:hypothetical protein